MSSTSDGQRLPVAPPKTLAAISIDGGRQLFVDDLLISYSTLHRSWHHPEVSENSPVLTPSTALEMNDGVMPAVHLCSDGVWFDPSRGLFRMWYMAGYDGVLAHATSKDGIEWVREPSALMPGTNQVLMTIPGFGRNGTTVWLDETAPSEERYKMFMYHRRTNGQWPRADPSPRPSERELGVVYTSPDGTAWSERGRTGPCGDTTSVYYDPFRERWVFSIRNHSERIGRIRGYVAAKEFVEGANWAETDIRLLSSADRDDLPDPALWWRPELYKLDAVAYESIMIGLFGMYFGPPNDESYEAGVPKTVDLYLGTSRDGLRWDRLDRSAFIRSARVEGAWNRGYLHAAGGICVVEGDELRFYFSGFSGISPARGCGPYAGASIGYATLRRDGFASMDGPGRAMRPPTVHLLIDDGADGFGDDGGILVTEPLRFSGESLYVNAKMTSGDRLRVAVTDVAGRVIPGWGLDECSDVTGDTTRSEVRWGTGETLGKLVGRAVRFAFAFDAGELYSFWVTSDPHGASGGYVAGEALDFPDRGTRRVAS